MSNTRIFWSGCLLIAFLFAASSPALASGLILNEWNAVGGSDFLKDSNTDSYFGEVEGNGGNWVELVVVEDHLNISGWELRWWEDDGDGNGTAIWDPGRVAGGASQGAITFTNNALWSDLRAGTIITLSEEQMVNTVDASSQAVSFDLSTNTSYDPLGGDFTIHVSTLQEAGEPLSLVSTQTNIDGDDPGSFSVGKKDWEMTIFDGMTSLGPIGEAHGDFGGIGGDEIGKLEADPSSLVTIDDYNDGSSSTFGSPNVWSSGSEQQDFSQLRALVPEPASLSLLVVGGLFALKRNRF